MSEVKVTRLYENRPLGNPQSGTWSGQSKPRISPPVVDRAENFLNVVTHDRDQCTCTKNLVYIV